MATIKVKKTTSNTAPSGLAHGELGATSGSLFFGNSSNTAVRLVNSTTTLPIGTDLNTVLDSGFYRLETGILNVPSGVNYSQLIVSRGSDTISQIIISYSTHKMYYRAGTVTNFSAWKEVIIEGDARLTNSRPASDVYSWAKQSTKPSYSWGEITSKPTWIGNTKPEYASTELTDYANLMMNVEGIAVTGAETGVSLAISGGVIPGLVNGKVPNNNLPSKITKTEITEGAVTDTRLAEPKAIKEAILEISPAGARAASSVNLSLASIDELRTTYGTTYFSDSVGSVYFGANGSFLYLKGIGRPRFYNNESQVTDDLAFTSDLSDYQTKLISGTNIKTINGNSLLGSGNIEAQSGPIPLRTRTGTTALTQATTSGIILPSFSVGDTLMIEVNNTSSYTLNPKIITITVGKSGSGTSTSASNICSWSTWNGTTERINSFNVGYSGTTIYFTDMKYVERTVSGTTMTFSTGTYTLYVGRIWKVNV